MEVICMDAAMADVGFPVNRKRSRADYPDDPESEEAGVREGEEAGEGDHDSKVEDDSEDEAPGYVDITLADLIKPSEYSKNWSKSFAELKDFLKEERRCPPEDKLFCEIPHAHMRFGEPLHQVFSITIHRNMDYPDPNPESDDIEIYGVIRLFWDNTVFELFERPQTNPLIFKKRDRKLTLPLKGPDDSSAFQALRGRRTLVCLLKYNKQNIFEPPSHTAFQRCCSVFDPDDNTVGCGIIGLPEWEGFRRMKFDEDIPMKTLTLESVAFVEAKVRTILAGMVGVLEFTALRDLNLRGVITARSCLAVPKIVLFSETQKVEVPSSKSIPLSASMIAIDCRSSLLVKIQLWDANTKEKMVDETVQFNVDILGSSSEKNTKNEAIKVKVKWTSSRPCILQYE